MEGSMIEQTVILDAYQWAEASEIGRRRDASSKAKGQQGRAGQSADRSLQNHIDGAAAEMAVCIALGLQWAAHIDTYLTEPDVEVPGLGGVEVKWTSGTGLIVRENEQREQIHVLVTGAGPIKRIVGWLDVEGLRALKASPKTDFGNGRAPAWLKPIEELNDWGLFPKKEVA
jgi:hypothetical protein